MGLLEQAQAPMPQPGMAAQQPGMPTQQPGMPTQSPAQSAQQPGMPTQQPGMATQPPGLEAMGDEEPATPEEQAEYERAANAFVSVIYGESGGDQTSDTVADSILAEDPVGTLIQTGITLIAEVDKQIDIDDGVLAQITQDIVEMLADVAEQKNGIVLEQPDLDAALMGLWEGVMTVVGGDEAIEPAYAEATAGLSPEDINAVQQTYDAQLSAAQQRQQARLPGAGQQPMPQDGQPQPMPPQGGPPHGQLG